MAKRKWEDEITDPKEIKVFEALADPDWDFRTVEGIAKSAKLTPKEVMEVIQKHEDLTRKSSIPDRHGREIYTLKEKNTETLEVLRRLRTFVSKSIQ